MSLVRDPYSSRVISSSAYFFATTSNRKGLAATISNFPVTAIEPNMVANQVNTIVMNTSGFPFASRIPSTATPAITAKTGTVIAANHRKTGRAGTRRGVSFMGSPTLKSVSASSAKAATRHSDGRHAPASKSSRYFQSTSISRYAFGVSWANPDFSQSEDSSASDGDRYRWKSGIDV